MVVKEKGVWDLSGLCIWLFVQVSCIKKMLFCHYDDLSILKPKCYTRCGGYLGGLELFMLWVAWGGSGWPRVELG